MNRGEPHGRVVEQALSENLKSHERLASVGARKELGLRKGQLIDGPAAPAPNQLEIVPGDFREDRESHPLVDVHRIPAGGIDALVQIVEIARLQIGLEERVLVGAQHSNIVDEQDSFDVLHDERASFSRVGLIRDGSRANRGNSEEHRG
jgi:hypothetical protein